MNFKCPAIYGQLSFSPKDTKIGNICGNKKLLRTFFKETHLSNTIICYYRFSHDHLSPSLFSCCYYAHIFHISKIGLFTFDATPASDYPKYTTFGELDLHPLTFLESEQHRKWTFIPHPQKILEL